ncbi:MAG: insulinase family protein [Bacteriovoracaceae bacterium]|nr:insulinase family protein [Bacteriovoracaceae bacterium]
MHDKFNSELIVGKDYFGFTVKKIEELPNTKSLCYTLEHNVTKAQMLHISTTDTNNCFGVTLKTIPMDSTGVAHILEHTALCGSKNYPTRDPFFSMIKRSVNTFMNAFTAYDWTMYPFASQNLKDFYNLMGVYVDAVFFPNLEELNFKQEGHRLEFSDMSDSGSPLEIKGIVYNEMKGAMSTPDRKMGQELMSGLFETTTYHYNSGGDPKAIPDLTYENFLEFHRRHYHPSNAYFYSYGHFPLIGHLEFLDKNVFGHFSKIDPNTEVQDENRTSYPKKIQSSYPLSKEENDGNQCIGAVAWPMGKSFSTEHVLTFKIIDHILLGHDGAILQKALLESNIGRALFSESGFQSDSRETTYFVGLQGVAQSDLEKIEALVMNTLANTLEKGIDPEEIKSAIHQIELESKDLDSGHYPFGLVQILNCIGGWIHGGDPVTYLNIDTTLDQIKKKLEDKEYILSLIKQKFIDNPHRVTLFLTPDENLTQAEEEEQAKHLEQIKAKLSDNEKNELITQAKVLKDFQEKESDLSCLPIIAIEDLDKSPKVLDKPFIKTTLGLNEIFKYEQNTNGLSYVNFLFSLKNFSMKERMWLPLFSSLLVQSGVGSKDYEEFAKEKAKTTGGFKASPVILTSAQSDASVEYFSLSSRALNQNLTSVFNLATDMINDWNFQDLSRTKTVIEKRFNTLKNSILYDGTAFSMSAASRSFSSVSYIKEGYTGIKQVQFMESLTNKSEAEVKEIVNTLNQIGKKVFQKDNLSIILISDEAILNSSDKVISDMLSKLKTSETSSAMTTAYQDLEKELQNPYHKEAWTTTTPVSYVTQCFKAPVIRDTDAASLKVLNRLITTQYLHPELREKGGAYGGYSVYDEIMGVFYLCSYRDPHFDRTVSTYNSVLQWLSNTKFSQEQLQEAILQVISGLDTPYPPSREAMKDYWQHVQGVDYNLRAEFRTQVLGCTLASITQAAKKYLATTTSLSGITSDEIYSKTMIKNLAKHKI